MTPSETTPRLTAEKRVLYKVIGGGIRCFTVASRLAYRVTPPWAGKLGSVDHVTIPCRDLRVAEEFYVGLLGARVALRLDAARLERIGWSPEDIEANHAAHLQLTFAGGPHLDVFEYPEGIPAATAPMHPHIALKVGPRQILPWKQRLVDHGVVVAGPTRPGPPGQASFYFNDPFGNHLELVTVGFTDQELPIGVPDRSQLNYEWAPAGLHLDRSA
ncbi:MAG: VOC family protein [Acidimicrobiaceae bacterium]|nr:VOC family protein [Acidimicrobiaceae bacterium]